LIAVFSMHDDASDWFSDTGLERSPPRTVRVGRTPASILSRPEDAFAFDVVGCVFRVKKGADQPVREHWQTRANLRLSAAWPARPAPLKPHWPTSSSSAVPSALGADRGPVRMERPPRLRRGVVLVLAVGRRQRVEAIRSLAHRAPVFGSNAGVARRITSSHTRLDLEGAYAELPV
jgi:hypothetical protein